MRAYLYKTTTAVVFMLCLWAVLQILLARKNEEALGGSASTPWQPTLEALTGTNALSPSKVDIVGLADKPLFSPTRKPFSPPPEIPPPEMEETVELAPPVPTIEPPQEVAPQVVEPPNFQLIGLISKDARRKGLFSSPEKPDGEWYTVGQEISGWTIKSLQDDQVVIELNSQTYVLKLYVDNSQLSLGDGSTDQ
jgi:hypothetical protein